jgi:NadR type nicotinamide-nucleotide adenylyltransferase
MSANPSGLIIGKFLPPHLGHQYLVDFARNFTNCLTVLVCSLKREPIPGELRYAWMQEMFPGVEVCHLTDENPQEPHEHPDFWNIWKTSIQKFCPNPGLVFASESYGVKLAEVLGAEFIPVNISRALVPVSGTLVRSDPMRYWNYLPPAVRPYFVKKVCLIGPESTGKSTLARHLADEFKTVFVHEYARDYLETRNNTCNYEDISPICRGHLAAEQALARQAHRVLICDTDPLTTKLWSEFFFQKCPAEVADLARTHPYDLHLLSDPGVPWVQDIQRFHPEAAQRQAFFGRCQSELEAARRPYRILSGSWNDRFRQAVEAVDDLIRRNGPPKHGALEGH